MKLPGILLFLLLLCFGGFTAARDAASELPGASSSAEQATVIRLPREARTTLDLINHGGPFPYSRDGSVFSNRESLLPRRERGYYHEYTVPTPGEHSRGARRIISGAGGERYYTDDHYQTFMPIQVLP